MPAVAQEIDIQDSSFDRLITCADKTVTILPFALDIGDKIRFTNSPHRKTKALKVSVTEVKRAAEITLEEAQSAGCRTVEEAIRWLNLGLARSSRPMSVVGDSPVTVIHHQPIIK